MKRAFSLSNKFSIEKVNETLDKFSNELVGTHIITKYDNRIVSNVEVSKIYYNFDFSDFCKKILLEIVNYFSPEAYQLRASTGVQELKLVGETVIIDNEEYMKMFSILNSTNRQKALQMHIGLVKKSDYMALIVQGEGHMSFVNKHYKSSLPEKIEKFSESLINFNLDIEFTIKTIEDLKTKDVDMVALVNYLSFNKELELYKTISRYSKNMCRKLKNTPGLTEDQYIYLDSPFSDSETFTLVELNSKLIFDTYLSMFKDGDSSIVSRETKRILDAIEYSII